MTTLNEINDGSIQWHKQNAIYQMNDLSLNTIHILSQ